MTDSLPPADRERLVGLAVRARGLRDPLGAKGHRRDTGMRVKREARARRGLAFAALASFLACFGIVSSSASGSQAPSAAPTSLPTRIDASVDRIARVQQVGIRSAVPTPTSTPRPHVRTRASR
jgi:hypothetical protein